MAHYVCKACKGMSEMAGNCGSAGCSMNGQPMMECSCSDNMHNMGGGATSAGMDSGASSGSVGGATGGSMGGGQASM